MRDRRRNRIHREIALVNRNGGVLEELDRLLWADFQDDLKLYREITKNSG